MIDDWLKGLQTLLFLAGLALVLGAAGLCALVYFIVKALS